MLFRKWQITILAHKSFIFQIYRDTWTYQDASTKLQSVKGNWESLAVHSVAHGHNADEATWTGQELADDCFRLTQTGEFYWTGRKPPDGESAGWRDEDIVPWLQRQHHCWVAQFDRWIERYRLNYCTFTLPGVKNFHLLPLNSKQICKEAAATFSRSSNISQHLVNTCSCIPSQLRKHTLSAALMSVSGRVKESLKCHPSTEAVKLHFLWGVFKVGPGNDSPFARWFTHSCWVSRILEEACRNS